MDFDLDFKIKYDNSEGFFHTFDHSNYFHNSFRIYARNGMLSYDNGGDSISWFPVTSKGIYSGYKVLSNKPDIIESNFNTLQLDFVNNLGSTDNQFSYTDFPNKVSGNI